jgi:hypothetical protein
MQYRWLWLACALIGCGGSDEDGGAAAAGTGGDPEPPKPLPELASAPLTTERTFVPTHPIVTSPGFSPSPQVPEDMAQFIADGFGALEQGPGLEVAAHTLDGAPPPAPSAEPKLLLRFVHLADTQLADDESPIRLVDFDSPGGDTKAAFRPQEGHECRILNAAVRTINALHRETPISFVVLGGDNADNAQTNELDWFQAVLGGAPSVHCDSGIDDDPVPGGNNDPKDPFVAEGLAVPWKWVSGNHDVLVQGNFPVDGFFVDAVAGYSANGTRDWSQPGGPVVSGDVPADEARAPMTRAVMVEKIAADGDGHGLDAAAIASGKAQYTFDVEGAPIRWIVIDTAAETGAASGLIRQGDVDSFIQPALDAAKADGKWVIIASHHSSNLLGDGGGFGGEVQPDAVTTEAWRALVGSYDNVLMHLAGHTHVHRFAKATTTGGNPYWEVETSALADWPHQVRVFEIWDQGGGAMTIRGIPVDFAVDDDPIAEEGRTLGVVDLTSGWGGDGSGAEGQRAIELWAGVP